MQYKIVSASSIEGLEEKVRNSIKDAWLLQGGICTGVSGRTFYQAMIKKDVDSSPQYLLDNL
jgi:hypothetical protein